MKNKTLYWCSNKESGDKVIIVANGQQYKGELLNTIKYPYVLCVEEPAATGTYTLRRGNKWGTTNIFIKEALDFNGKRS